MPPRGRAPVRRMKWSSSDSRAIASRVGGAPAATSRTATSSGASSARGSRSSRTAGLPSRPGRVGERPADRSAASARSRSLASTSSRRSRWRSSASRSSSSTSRPRCTIPIRVASRSTSPRMWLDMNTVTPCSVASVRINSRISMTPAGSRPLAGSSSTSSSGAGSSALARARRWRLPSDSVPARWSAYGLERQPLDDRIHGATVRHSRQPARDVEVVADAEFRIGGRALHQMADPSPEARRPGSDPLAEEFRVAGRRPDHAEQHPDRGRLARAVEAEEGVDLASGDAQVDAVDGEGAAPVALGQAGRLDREIGHPPGLAVDSRARRGRTR